MKLGKRAVLAYPEIWASLLSKLLVSTTLLRLAALLPLGWALGLLCFGELTARRLLVSVCVELTAVVNLFGWALKSVVEPLLAEPRGSAWARVWSAPANLVVSADPVAAWPSALVLVSWLLVTLRSCHGGTAPRDTPGEHRRGD